MKSTRTPDSATHDSPAMPFAADARMGRLMLAIGVTGLVFSAAVIALGLRLVDRTGTTLERSLQLTSEAVRTVDDTIAIAADAIGAAATGLETLTAAVVDSEASLQSAGTLLADTGVALSEDVPASIDAIRETMPALIQSAEVLNTALGALAVFGVDFAPETPPADSLRRVETGLGGIADQLRASSGELSTLGTGLTGLGTGAGSLSSNLSELQSNLAEADKLLTSYSATTSRTATLVFETSADLADQRSEGRLIVLLLGVVIGLGQAVPLSIAWSSRSNVETRFGGRPIG